MLGKLLISGAVLAASAFPNKLTLGTDYYPEAWDPSQWEADAQAMNFAGISMVRVAGEHFVFTVALLLHIQRSVADDCAY